MYQETPRNVLGILIANFTSNPVYLTEYQAVEKVAEHTVDLIESTMTHDKMLGVVATKTVYNKLNKCTRDIDVINERLLDSREADETIDTDNVKLGVDEKYNR